MTVSRKTRRKLLTWLIVTTVSALIGTGYVTTLTYFVEFELTHDQAILQGAKYGAVIGGSWSALHLFYMQGAGGAWVRRLSFLRGLFVRAVLTAVLMFVALLFGRTVFTGMALGDPDLYVNFPRDMAFSLAAFLVIYFVLQMRDIIGGRVLVNFVIGRYNKPVREDRVFLFLDLTGSTAIAETLGDVGAQALIARFFFDVDEVTTEYGGETHRYIGDEVVVTWPLADGVRDARCLRCVFAIRDRLDRQAKAYEAVFGIVPGFRVGLHGGPVVAGEIGGSKKEIVYFGDTVNTAARIEQQCKTRDLPLLVSGDLLRRMVLPDDLRAESLGRVVLRGHDHDIELFAVRRADPELAAGPAVPTA